MPTVSVNVKFVAYELVPGLRNGEYCVESGSTVRDLIAVCEAGCGATVPEKNYKFIYPLLNGRPLAMDSAITEGGTLHVCRVATGG